MLFSAKNFSSRAANQRERERERVIDLVSPFDLNLETNFGRVVIFLGPIYIGLGRVSSRGS